MDTFFFLHNNELVPDGYLHHCNVLEGNIVAGLLKSTISAIKALGDKDQRAEGAVLGTGLIVCSKPGHDYAFPIQRPAHHASMGPDSKFWIIKFIRVLKVL